MSRRKKIYEGKAKIMYEGPEPGTLVQYFKDDATAFNAKKKEVIDGKGVLNNRLSEFFMSGLNQIGVPTHFIRRINMREQLIRLVEIIPLEVVVRIHAAGTLSERLGIEEGTLLPRPIVEFCLKDDALGDPLVSEEHIVAFGWASQHDLDDMIALALRGQRLPFRLHAGCWHPPRRLQDRGRARLGWRFPALDRGRRDQPPIPVACGTSSLAKSSTRTSSAATWETLRMPTPRWRAASASCLPTSRTRPSPRWSTDRHVHLQCGQCAPRASAEDAA